MKRQAEFLVEKRDGRTEWLRSTKLARSIHLALQSVGIDEDWRAIELASAVITGLRQLRRSREASGARLSILNTVELADAVQHVLVATGQANAAAAYGAIAAERSRRSRALLVGRGGAPTEGPVVMTAGRRLREDGPCG